MRSPLISIIVAVFNGIETVQQCIDSVNNQSYSNIELIVIDGGSTDNTQNLLELNKEKFSYWISEPDNGIYSAWNKALLQAKGKWICFLGADDFLWEKDVISRTVIRLVNVPVNVHVAYGQVMLVSDAGRTISVVGEPWRVVKERFKQVMGIPHQGVFHRRSLFEKHGEFDASFRIAGDYEFLLRELKDGDAVFVPEIIAGMRQGGVSNRPENTIKALREIRLAQKMHGFKVPGIIWILAYIRSYIRTWVWNVLGERYTVKILDFYRRVMGLPAYWTKL